MNKKALRTVAIALMAILLSGLLSGCQQEKKLLDPDNPVDLTVWHYYNSIQLTAFDNMVEEFNQTKGRELGIFVQSYSQGNVNELFNKVLDTANGIAGEGSLPDLFLAYTDSAYELKVVDRIVDLSQYMTEAEIAEYVDGFWQEGVIEGKPYVFPIAKSTELALMDELAWNRFVEASGYDKTLDEAFQTWEALVDAAQAYYSYTDGLTPEIPHDGKALFGIDSISNYALVGLKQLGVDFMKSENGKGVLNYDERALRTIWDTYVGSMARGYFAAEGRFSSDDTKTDIVMGFLGSSVGIGYFPDQITSEDGSQREAKLRALSIPYFEEGERYVVQQGAGMVVTKSDERRETAAVEFIKWLTDVERNVSFAVDSAYLPVKKAALEGEAIENTLQALEASGDDLSANTAIGFRVAIKELNEYGIYFAEPFIGRLQVRYLFDDLKDMARQMRADILAATESGTPYEEAIENACGDAAFARWLEDFKGSANDIL